MQQTHMHKAVTRPAEAKKWLSRRRQSEYSMNRVWIWKVKDLEKIKGILHP